MIADALVLLGENRFSRSLSAEDAIATADRLGVDRLVAAPARPFDYHLGPANDALAEAAGRTAGRLTALGRVDPTDGGRGVAEARRCLRDLGFVGLFVHPLEEAFRITDARDVLAVAAEAQVPVVVATGFPMASEPLQVAQVAGDFPDTPIVMTNGGNINISGLSLADAWLALKLAPNLLVTTNGEYRQDFVERLASELEPGRVMFASMTPYFDAVFEFMRVRSARMSDHARVEVEGLTAARVFGIE